MQHFKFSKQSTGTAAFEIMNNVLINLMESSLGWGREKSGNSVTI